MSTLFFDHVLEIRSCDVVNTHLTYHIFFLIFNLILYLNLATEEKDNTQFNCKKQKQKQNKQTKTKQKRKRQLQKIRM